MQKMESLSIVKGTIARKSFMMSWTDWKPSASTSGSGASATSVSSRRRMPQPSSSPSAVPDFCRMPSRQRREAARTSGGYTGDP